MESLILILCILSLPRARMRSRGRVFGLSVSLFVCQFVHHFLAYSGVLGLFKVSFSSMKIALVIKLTHLEAQKSLFYSHLDAS